MNIYTYYDIVPQMLEDSQLELIEIWKESWIKNGWNPIVLNSSYLRCTENEIEYLNNLPSVNPKAYEMACFLRWNSMISVGGGWMCDYDVINCGFTPEDSKNYESLSILQGHVPCLVYGEKEDYEKVFKIFSTESLNFTINHTDDIKHTSDMIVMANIKNRESFIKCHNEVDGYPKKESSKIVHCSANRCTELNLSKKEAMLSIL
jgi:hypothetical protein